MHLSIGTIHQTLHEAAAAVAPAEAALLADIQHSGLLHADETSWPQQEQRRWLWVFLTTTTTLYVIAGRGKATVTRVLDGFTGWLMSDGWFSYRGYPQRLRCWAHLLRKAQGLIEGYDADGRRFGRQVRTTLDTLMAAIYAARDGPGGVPVDLGQRAGQRHRRRPCRRGKQRNDRLRGGWQRRSRDGHRRTRREQPAHDKCQHTETSQQP